MNTNKIIDKIKEHASPIELSRASGVSRRSIHNIRSGTLPSVRTLAKLEAALWPKKAAKLPQATSKEV